jgi:DNA-3-methyladenine glycosylase II
MEAEVRLLAPLDVAGSLEMFRRAGDDGIDRWDGSTLVRTVLLDGGAAAYTVTTRGTVGMPRVAVTTDRANDLQAVTRLVQRTFVADEAALAGLRAIDPVIAALDDRYPGLRPVRQFDLLGALVRSISAQQVNLEFATVTRRRLAEAFGQRYAVDRFQAWRVDAAVLAGLRVADLRALQFSNRKAEYIIGAAQAIAAGELSLQVLEGLPDEEVISRLTGLRGIGVWTAEWLLARTLGRPRVVAGDLGVRKAVGLLYLDGALPSEAQVREATAHWGAAAGIAQVFALQALAAAGTRRIASSKVKPRSQ